MARRRWLPVWVGAILCAFLLFDLWISIVGAVDNPLFRDIFYVAQGVMHAQIALVAAFTVLGPASVAVRFSVGIVATSVVSLACLVSFRDGGLLVCGAAVLQWIPTGLLFWVVTLGGGRKLGTTEPFAAPRSTDVHFGIRELLAWTIVVGTAITIGRHLLPDNAAYKWVRYPQTMSAQMIILATFHSLSGCGTILTFCNFGSRVLGLCFCIAVWTLEPIVYQVVFGFAQYHAFWLVNGVQASATLIPLLPAISWVSQSWRSQPETS